MRCSPPLPPSSSARIAPFAAMLLLFAPGCQTGDNTSNRRDGSPDAPRDASTSDVPDGGTDGIGSDGSHADGSCSDSAEDDCGAARCPPCMVLIEERFCMDRYEASRPDATDTAQGSRSDVAQCSPGVIPWHSSGLTRQDAASACAAADKRLCTTSEWLAVCRGPTEQVYSYGDDYDPVICNGIDRYCDCDPYPHCYGACGGNFRVAPTASHTNCRSAWGIFDMNGNVWEVVDHGDGKNHFRGGAYNCIDSERLHRCDHDADWGPSARGFRCCADPMPNN
jgi:sulfatase modifying factor 1